MICKAFDNAKTDVEFKFERKEADLFKMITQKDHACIAFSKRNDGSFECLSNHTQIKRAKSKLSGIDNREK